MCGWTTGVLFVIFLSNCDSLLKNDSFKGLRHTHKGSRDSKPLNMPFSIDDYDSKINIVLECDSIYIICIERRLRDMLIRIRFVKESIKVILEYIILQYNLEIKLDVCIAKKSNSTTTTTEYTEITEPPVITESTEVTETKPTTPTVEYTDITDSTKITESTETTETTAIYKPKTKSTTSTVEYTDITDFTKITESTETTETTAIYKPKTKSTTSTVEYTEITDYTDVTESTETTDYTKITETMRPTMTTDYDVYTTATPCPPEYYTTKPRTRPTIPYRTTKLPPCVIETTTKGLDSESESDSSSYESDEDPSMRRTVETKSPKKITSRYSLNPYAIETVPE